MSTPLPVAIALSRGAGALSRSFGGGATSVPGQLLRRLRASSLRELAAELSAGCVLVSATNGKTSTATMAAEMLRRAGVQLVHNSAGANMPSGIASALLAASTLGGVVRGEIGLFEVDEAWLPLLAAEVHPRVILLGNLFRDQLDRYGELELILQRWAQTVGGAGAAAGAQLVLNADDPAVADLGGGRDRVIWFGLEDDQAALGTMAHAADAKHCRSCGAPYRFSRVYLGHLGIYSCPSCGHERPTPHVLARNIELQGVRSASFDLHLPQASARVRLPLPGLYNVYNAVGSAALAYALEVPFESILEALQQVKPAFGRGEAVEVDGGELRILLIKNPAGANEVLRTLELEDGELHLLCILNDRVADGRDVSWIWDADFERLADRLASVVCAGSRAPEIALRLKYAGVEGARISLAASLQEGLQAAIQRADGDARKPVYALPTYTAMLELRALLVKRGDAKGSFS